MQCGQLATLHLNSGHEKRQSEEGVVLRDVQMPAGIRALSTSLKRTEV